MDRKSDDLPVQTDSKIVKLEFGLAGLAEPCAVRVPTLAGRVRLQLANHGLPRITSQLPHRLVLTTDDRNGHAAVSLRPPRRTCPEPLSLTPWLF